MWLTSARSITSVVNKLPMAVPIAIGAEITLNHEDNQCYLTATGTNEQPTVRVETGRPLLSFEKSVFTLIREAGGSLGSAGPVERPLSFGSVVNLYSPVTKTAAVVLKTEQSDGSVGLRVVMRPLDERSSVFRIQPKFKSRLGSDVVMHGDSVVLMVDNSDLFLCVGEGSKGLEVVATGEPAVWTINRYDRGASVNTQGVVHAGRVLAMQHRVHQTMLVHGIPTIPSQRKMHNRRHTLWQPPQPDVLPTESASAGASGDVATRNRYAAVLDEPTTDVYFVASSPDSDEATMDIPSGGLWIAENVDPTNGGPLVAGERYRFRHFVSGRYLSIFAVGSANVEYSVVTLSPQDEGMLERTLWDLESSAESEFGYLSSYHSYVRLRHVTTGQWLGAVSDNDFAVVPALPTGRTHSRDRLLLRHAPKQVEADLFFIMAQLHAVQEFTAHFHALQDYPRSTDRVLMNTDTRSIVERTQDAVMALVSFASAGENADVDHLGLPHPEKQRRFGELGAAKLLFDAILSPFHSRGVKPSTPVAGGALTLSDIHRKEVAPIQSVLRVCFRLLRQIVFDCPDNAEPLMPYLPVLLFLESCNVQLGPALGALVAHAPANYRGDELKGILEKLFILNVRVRHPMYIEAIASCCCSPEAVQNVVELLQQYPATLTATLVELGRLIVYPDGDRDSTGYDNAMPIEMFIAHGDLQAVTYYGASARLLLSIARCKVPTAVEFCQFKISRDEILLVLSSGFRDAKSSSLADSIKATYTELATVLYLATDLAAAHQPRVMVVSAAATTPSRPFAMSGGVEGPFMRQMKMIALDTLKTNATQVLELVGRNALLWHSTVVWHMFVKAHLASPAELHEVIPMLINILDGSTDVISLTTTTEMVWDRYLLTDENAVILHTKTQICDLLHTFFAMRCEDAVNEVVHNVTSGATAPAIYKIAMSNFEGSIHSVDLPRLHKVLLDLVLYESTELRRTATNLLSDVIRHRQIIAHDVHALHVLSSRHSESYTRVVELITLIQAGTSSRVDEDKITAAFVAVGQLTNVLHNLLGSSNGDADLGEPTSPTATGSVEYLDLLRVWGVHTMVLDLLPAPSESRERFARCTEFLVMFCHNDANQPLIAPRWPIFFDAMEAYPAELGRAVLQLLSKIWARGNIVCPAERRDIRVVLSMFSRDETNVDALKALVALLSSGVPAPRQQRHVIILLQEFDVISGQWWMTRPPACVLALTRLLELCCTGNNSFTRRIVQAKFPVGMVLRIIASTNVSRIGFKTALVRFLAIVHFANEEDTPHHLLVQNSKLLTQDEGWWRLIRDDLLVRFDEVATGVEIQKPVKPFVLEAALALEAFFLHRFPLGFAAAKTEWLLKEIRGVLASVAHLMQSLDGTDFTVQEKQVFVSLARSIAVSTSTINDTTVAKLRQLADNAVLTESARPNAQGELPDKEAVLLAEVKTVFMEALPPDDDTFVDVLLSIVRPVNINDQLCWRRRVLKKLLSACAIQDFEATAITTVLKLSRRCIETTVKTRQLAMQILFENIGAVRTATVLMDAVNPHIVLEGLKFGIAVIDNGAREVQDNFLDYLESNDEKFFVAMKRCVDKAILELQHWRRLVIQSASQQFDLRSDQTCFSYVTCVLRFVQLMCEGHHYGMQEYIREQKDNLRSVNALQVALSLLRALLTGDTSQFEEELIQCLELLTEFCQGPCVGNQALLLSANVCPLLNYVLSDAQKSASAKLAAVTTLLSVLEGCTDAAVADTVLRQVPLATMEKVFMLPTTTEESTELVFSTGILLRNLSDLVSSKPTLQFPLQQILKQRKDVGLLTGRIQVERGGLLESVYFRIPGPCLTINDETKLKLLWNVDRSSQAAKHSSFYELCDDLILELELMERQQAKMAGLAKKYLPAKITRRGVSTFEFGMGAWIRVSLLLGLFINFLFLIDYDDDDIFIIPLFSLAQVVVSGIIAYIDWSVDGAVYFHKYKKELQQRMISKSEDYLNTTELIISDRKEALLKANRGRSQFCFALLGAAILGLLGYQYMLVAHLFWVITLSPAFANVIAAITQNAKTLSLTIVLGLLFLYSFSMFGYAMFPEDFDTDLDLSTRENCNSLLHCFLFVTTTGLRQGGGIGDVMREKSWTSSHFFTRKAFDFLFFAVMIIVFLNILFGIIIDTFAELRDAKTRKEDDMRLKCFICGIDSHVFDRHGEGFVWHTKHEHNLWQYLYFIYHLRLKDPNDYTGQESYIASRLELKDFSFFPTRCLSLETKTKKKSSDSDRAALRPTSEPQVNASIGAPAALLSMEMVAQFDNIRTTVRRVLQRNMLVEANSADAQYRVVRQPDGRTIRQALDSSTQTHLSESVASLQYDLAAAETAKARLSAEIEAMKQEMRSQVEELWKLKVSNLNSVELHANIHTLKTDVKDLQRQLALVTTEKETLLRQNSFLQDEADRLMVLNAKLQAADHLDGISGTSRRYSSVNEIMRDAVLDRSRLYESLQLTLPDTTLDDDEANAAP
jgi:hypothetical protein